MGDAENALPPSKKRAAGREISRDNPGLDDEEDTSEFETGTFKKASEDVLANRRIVKVRRSQTTSTASTNPFSGIRLVAPTQPAATPSAAHESGTTTAQVTADALISSEKEVSEDAKNDMNKSENSEDGNNLQSEKKLDESDPDHAKNENESKKDEPNADAVAQKESDEDKSSDVVKEETQKETNDEKPAGVVETKDEDKKDDETVNADSKDKSNENADATAEGASLSSFQQLSSSQNAFTGLAGTGFSTSSFSFGSTTKDGATGSFGFGLSTKSNGNSSLFNTSGTSIVSKSEGSGFPAMQEVPVETGEENEKSVFSADSVLFEFMDGGWKERGKGELKVNVSTTGAEKARLVMRARGNYRLILNASLYPDMKLTNMEKKGITFACMNSTGEEKVELSTFALKFKDTSIVEEFKIAVNTYKGNTATVLKTPENSPNATEV